MGRGDWLTANVIQIGVLLCGEKCTSKVPEAPWRRRNWLVFQKEMQSETHNCLMKIKVGCNS
jgi:hypothetical protein